MTNMEHVQIISQLVEDYIDKRLEITHQAIQAQLTLSEEQRVIAISQAETLRDELAVLQVEAEKSAADVVRLTAESESKTGMILTLENTSRQQADRITELLAQIKALEEAGTGQPTPLRSIVGACPLSGALSAKGRDNVVQRWGAGSAVRLFASGGFAASPAPALGAAGRLLMSWKPDLSRPIDEAECLTALKDAPAGSKVGVWHEPDVKYRQSVKASVSAATAELNSMKARAREFYGIVKLNRPDLVVMAVLSGWTFDPSTSYNPLDYIEFGSFDVLAVDLDGTEGPKDFRPVADEAAAFAEAVGVGWTVGEFGTKLEPGFTNADRVPWLTEQASYLQAMPIPPQEICLFEVDTIAGRPYILTTAAEVSAWKAQAQSAG